MYVYNVLVIIQFNMYIKYALYYMKYTYIYVCVCVFGKIGGAEKGKGKEKWE